MYVVWTLICGAFVGWLAGKLMKTSGGLIKNIIVGVIGSAIGSFLCTLIGIYAYGFIFGIIVDVIGACLLLWIINKLAG